MQITGYLKTSLIEWPGKIASVIFTPGCNFRCPFCHNADLVNIDKVERLPRVAEKQILADLRKRKKWIDAVVVTGGEPTLQEDLPEFLRKVGDLGFLRMIHTNGTRPETIASLLHCSIVDYVAMDIKGNFDEYQNFTNVKAQSHVRREQISNVKSSIELIAKSGVEYEFRTTIVPGLHDKKNLIRLAEQIKFLVQSSTPRLRSGRECKVQSCHWYLQQFQPKNTLNKKFLKVEPFKKEEIEHFQQKLKKIIPQTYLRGV